MNRGARTLNGKKTGTIDELAAKLGFERTYCGRVLSGKVVPGLSFRQKARGVFGIPLHHWDEPVPDLKKHAA